mmetsp:Transcript_32512/g.56243  ORF Transcript_32512/g.56243 Transcript_32512/m.56243 type:complete len:167 (-) Transcript_32512:1321-1821(-)
MQPESLSKELQALLTPAESNSKQAEVAKLLAEKTTLYKVIEESSLPPLIKKRQKVKEETAGPNWFNMKAPEMTPELKQEVSALMLRRYVDPKHFYKKNDIPKPPKFFQIATILDSPLETRSQRLPKSERAGSLAEQMMKEDAKIQFTHRKFDEIMSTRKKRKRDSK